MNPTSPQIWITSLRRGKHLKVFDADSPKGLPPLTSVYMGRKTGDQDGSPLANPYPLRDEADRERVIQDYRRWLRARAFESPVVHEELLKILRLSLRPEGVALSCWCVPKACHVQVIREVVLAYFKAGWR